MQVAIGTIKLDGTENAVTAEQAKELLPLWETLQVLEGSDTAATEEKDALDQPDPGNDDPGTNASHHRA